MNPPQPHFFQAFFGPQNAQIQQIPEYITHNEFILEIITNWEWINKLISKYKAGNLKKVDQLDQLWLNFITKNNIDITKYKNEEEFLKVFWRIPEN